MIASAAGSPYFYFSYGRGWYVGRVDKFQSKNDACEIDLTNGA